MKCVALRKESVDRNRGYVRSNKPNFTSLSARRAWIEIKIWYCGTSIGLVALRKESVDRNIGGVNRAIDIVVALRKESVDRNCFNY